MRIGFDIDGVFAEVFPAMVRMFITTTGRDTFLPGDVPEPHDYNVQRERGYTPDEEKRVWDTVALSPEWWFNLPALPEVEHLKSIMWEVMDDHEVYFITARRGIHVKVQTEDWLRAQFNVNHFPTVLIVGHGQKGNVAQALNLDAYIDDNVDNALDVVRKSPTTKTALVNRNYNQLTLKFPSDLPTASEVTTYWLKERLDRNRVASVRDFLQRIEVIPYTTGVATH